MSGVNAHAIFAPAPDLAPYCAAPTWQHVRQRYWAVPEPHHLLGPLRDAKFGKSASFVLDLCKPEFAYLGDHQVISWSLSLKRIVAFSSAPSMSSKCGWAGINTAQKSVPVSWT